MLRRARVEFSWTNPPSADDIRKLDLERLLQNPILTEPGTEEELSVADYLLNARSPRDIAAAFVKMYRAQLPAPEDISEVPAFRPEKHGRPEAGGRHERREQGKKSHKKTPYKGGPREHAPSDYAPREHSPRDHAPPGERTSRPGDMVNGVWFKLSVGRERNADPKWLLPDICRQGEVTKKEIGAIRIYERETRFQVDASVAEKFAMLVADRQKGGVRIFPAPEKLPFYAVDEPKHDRSKPKHFAKKHDGEKPKKWPPKHKKKHKHPA
jgi:ATP-dependent RNA helicase DeaD